MPDNLTLVVEDLLGEVTTRQLLRYIDPQAEFINCIGKRGVGYIQNKLKNLNTAANGMKIVVVADRDRPQNCPIELIQRWIGTQRHQNLVVRFAEMEIESWIIADQERMASFLDVPLNRVTSRPDNLLHPKEEIINIARHSRSRRIREDICPSPGSKAVVGPAYNNALELFIKGVWRPDVACENSPSLRRAEQRLRDLVTC